MSWNQSNSYDQGDGQRYENPYADAGITYNSASYPVHQDASPESAANYSNLQGRRKALLVGINYEGTSAALKGCHNDVENLSEFVQQRFGYRQDDMVILLDQRGGNEAQQPTRDNILRAMQWLVQGAQPNDALFFHYSGHGSQVQTDEKDEADGLAETICPIDYESAGQITDDEMHRIMVTPLPQGCRLTAIFDCCHSGSSLDLSWTYSTSGQVKGPDHFDAVKDGAISAFKAYNKKDIGGLFGSLVGTVKKVVDGNEAQEVSRKTKASDADVISWSGCKDEQTSADAVEGGEATGAMSHAFVAALTQNPNQTYLQLLNSIRDKLKEGGYDQKPQLSCAHELDCNLPAAF